MNIWVFMSAMTKAEGGFVAIELFYVQGATEAAATKTMTDYIGADQMVIKPLYQFTPDESRFFIPLEYNPTNVRDVEELGGST